MNPKEFNKLKEKINKILSEERLFGIKGRKIHPNMRKLLVNMKSKRLEKFEIDEEKLLEDFDTYVAEHKVRKTVSAEEKILDDIIRDLVYLYYIMDSLTLYEAYDLGRLIAFAKKMSVGKNPNLKKLFNKIADEWREVIKQKRDNSNAVERTFKGGSVVNLALFKAIHKEGYMKRRKERSLLKDCIKTEKQVEQALQDLEKGHNVQQAMQALEQEESLITGNFQKLSRLYTQTWEQLNTDLGVLNQKVADAVRKNELPQMETRQVNDLVGHVRNVVAHNAVPKLRTEIQQLEALYKELAANI